MESIDSGLYQFINYRTGDLILLLISLAVIYKQYLPMRGRLNSTCLYLKNVG